jgi:cytochrome P450
VTPGKNWRQLCNAEAVADIFARKAKFARPTEMLGRLNVFGPNLGTTEGQQWQRYRKITVACFNESNNGLVWEERIRQATGMLRYWSSKPSINSVADDAWASESCTHFEARKRTSYKDSLKMILDNCIPLVAPGPNNLKYSWLPKSWRELHQVTVTFRNYMTTVYEEEKQSVSDGKTEGNNLMTSLVRASQAVTASSENGLAEQEIYVKSLSLISPATMLQPTP